MGGTKDQRSGVTRIILGSVPPELGPERAAVERALTRLRESALPGLEWVPFNVEDVTGAIPGEVAQCQVYIGLLADQGSTFQFEPEYRRAMQHGLHCLVYIKDNPTAAPKKRRGKTKPPPAPSSFADELIKSGAAVLFSGPADLEAKVTADLNPVAFRSTPRSRAGVRDSTRNAPTRYTGPHYQHTIGEQVRCEAGRDVVKSSIITGNHNVVYQDIVSCRYPSLKDYAIDFGDLIEKTTNRFVGRAELRFRRLDGFPRSGLAVTFGSSPRPAWARPHWLPRQQNNGRPPPSSQVPASA